MDETGVIVIQVITTEWTKNSRSAPFAAKRNAVPEAFAVPVDLTSSSRPILLLHRIDIAEWNDFAYHEWPVLAYQSVDELPLSKIGAKSRRHYNQSSQPLSEVIDPWFQIEAVRFRIEPPTLHISCSPLDGLPPVGRPAMKLTLQQKEWGRTVRNARDPYRNFGECGWIYVNTVVNVGYFAKLRSDCFLSKPPVSEIRQLANVNRIRR